MDDEYKKLFQSLRSTVKDLQAQLNSAQNQLNKLEGTIKFLELKVQEPKIDATTSRDAFSPPKRFTEFKAEPYAPTRTINLQSNSTIGIRRQPQYQQPNLQPSSEQGIVAEFNALAKQGGHNLKTSRDDFTRKYSVRAFNCANFEARMNEPVPAPSFVEAPSAPSGEYWAVPLKGNSFAVFPNIRTYSDNHHTARAMGEVFKSNFTAGRTYSDITVEQPAVFDCSETTWFLKHKGILRLG